MPPTRTRPARKASARKPYEDPSSGEEDDMPDLEQLEENEYKPDTHEDELEEDDIKPDVDEEEAVDIKPAKGRRKPSKKAKTSPAAAGTGGKWTAEEDWALFQAIFPRAPKIDWGSVSTNVGRDSKACQNRFYVLDKKKKLEAAIKAISKTT